MDRRSSLPYGRDSSPGTTTSGPPTSLPGRSVSPALSAVSFSDPAFGQRWASMSPERRQPESVVCSGRGWWLLIEDKPPEDWHSWECLLSCWITSHGRLMCQRQG